MADARKRGMERAFAQRPRGRAGPIRIAAAVLLILAGAGALPNSLLAPAPSMATTPASVGEVVVLPFEGAIGPVAARYILAGLERAQSDGAAAVVLEMDTPGGLDASMRTIIKGILASPVPVIVYVAPGGARAASAGMYIALSAPVIAMAPGTNIGAATPVSITGGHVSPDTTMESKVRNDAAAYARSLAARYGRNARWAERAVRFAASLSAEEAVRDTVADLLAPDLRALLKAVDGRTVRTSGGDAVLRTAGAPLVTLPMSWRERLLAAITDPSIAYLLFLAGILGIGLELYHPGAILPGVVGGIALILAFFAFQNLPVNAAGILLILLGVVLFVLEVKVTSYGVLSLGGIVSLVLGSLLLFERDSDLRVSLSVLVPAVAVFAAFFIFVVYMGARAQKRPRMGGAQGMIGWIGEAVTELVPEGKVFIRGEYWNARSTAPVQRGARVRVVRVEGLKLEVEPAPDGPLASTGGTA